jgi:hypothetical protein
MENEHEQMETGANTGDARENRPDAAGFTAEHDRLFRSHFQHANRLADRSYESMRPAYEHGWSAASDPRMASRPFEEVEHDLEAGWLNVRTGIGEWASVREYVRAGYAARAGEPPINRMGFVADVVPGGGDDTNDRPPFADPMADAADPTAPWSPEQMPGPDQ